MKAVVAEHGEVVIPEPIRVRFGIEPNTILDFLDEGEQLVVRKVSPEELISRYYGCLHLEQSTDELIRELRGEL